MKTKLNTKTIFLFLLIGLTIIPSVTAKLIPDFLSDPIEQLFDGVPDAWMLKFFLFWLVFALIYGITANAKKGPTANAKGVAVTISLAIGFITVLGIPDDTINFIFGMYGGILTMILILGPVGAIIFYLAKGDKKSFLTHAGLALAFALLLVLTGVNQIETVFPIDSITDNGSYTWQDLLELVRLIAVVGMLIELFWTYKTFKESSSTNIDTSKQDKRQNNAAQDELRKLQDDQKRIQDENAKLQEQIALHNKAKADEEEAKKEIEEANEEAEKIKKKLEGETPETLPGNITEYKEKLDGITKKIEDTYTKIDDAKKRIDQAKTNANKIEKNFNKELTDIERIPIDNEKIKNEQANIVNKLTNDLANKKAEFQTKKHSGATKNDLDALDKEISDIEQAIKLASTKYQEAIVLQKSLGKTTQSQLDLIHQGNQILKNIASEELKVERLEQEVKNIGKRDIKNKVKQLKDQLSSLQKTTPTVDQIKKLNEEANSLINSGANAAEHLKTAIAISENVRIEEANLQQIIKQLSLISGRELNKLTQENVIKTGLNRR